MDMGVGAFVFSQGVVSATPIIRSISYPMHSRLPLIYEIMFALDETKLVVVLGLARVMLVKSTQYPVSCLCLISFQVRSAADDGTKEHVTEYGVHWNFFLTLALVPVLRAIFLPFMRSTSISLLGLLVALGL
jgi:glucosaminylphosphatidylinositol acyltransferase